MTKLHICSKISSAILIYSLFFILIITSCQYGDKSSRYRGFEKVINEKEIALISTPANAKPLEIINIPHLNDSHFDFAKSIGGIRYVSLQKTPKSVIGHIDRIFCNENRIIIVDKKITESVFIFDASGKYINTISGKDMLTKSQPNDFSHFFSAAFYPSKKEIVLYDDKKEKFYFFSDNGDFIKEERAYFGFSDFANLFGTDYFVYLSLYNYNKHIPILNTSDIYLGMNVGRINSISQKVKQTVRIKNDYYYEYNLAQSGKQLFYTPVFSDTIYEIRRSIDGIYPKFKLNFPGENLSEKIRSNPKIDINKLVKLMNTEKYYSFEGKTLSLNDSIFYFECHKNSDLGYFYSTKTKKVIGGEIRSTNNRADSLKIDMYTYPIASTGEEFISVLDPATYSYIPNLVRTKKLSNALKGFNSKSNPILIFYNITPF